MPRLIAVLAVLAAGLPSTLGWGYLGHEAVAYIATDFVADATKNYFQSLLDDTSDDYLATVATWADEWKETDEGAFSYDYHFIDAQDDPPTSCGIDLERDCGDGCVVTALANYTKQLVDSDLSTAERQIAAKLIIHFVGDIGQPLHCDSLDVGGNSIDVMFSGDDTNLHSVWDSSIPEAIAGGDTKSDAKSWGASLSSQISSGSYASKTAGWVKGLTVADIEKVALDWATESNAAVCTVVIPEGVTALETEDLADDYTDVAVPTVSLQIAKQGYRLAKLLDAIVNAT